jgi:hypothetical protein
MCRIRPYSRNELSLSFVENGFHLNNPVMIKKYNGISSNVKNSNGLPNLSVILTNKKLLLHMSEQHHLKNSLLSSLTNSFPSATPTKIERITQCR